MKYNRFEEERDDGYGRFENRRSHIDWRKFNDKGEEVERECKRCGKWKDVDEYIEDDTIHSGRSMYCRDCKKDLVREKNDKRRIEKGKEKLGYKNGILVKRFDGKGKVIERCCLECKEWFDNVEDWMGNDIRMEYYCKSCNEYRKLKKKGIYGFDDNRKVVKRKCSTCKEWKSWEKKEDWLYGVGRCNKCRVERGEISKEVLISKGYKFQ
jgi:hypothetical protein